MKVKVNIRNASCRKPFHGVVPGRRFCVALGCKCPFLFGQPSLLPVLHEIFQRTVIGALSLRGEETAGDLAFLPMIQDAPATVAPLVAGGIGTGAMFDGFR